MTSLRRWRLGQGLSLEDVSALTGVSVSELSRVERAQRALSPLRRVEMARRLRVRVRVLFPPEETVDGGRGEAEPSSADAEITA